MTFIMKDRNSVTDAFVFAMMAYLLSINGSIDDVRKTKLDILEAVVDRAHKIGPNYLDKPSNRTSKVLRSAYSGNKVKKGVKL